jgi:hypothetical protein
MSETVTIGGSYTATIYGTFALATAYLQTQFGDAYTAWLALSTDNQKRALAAAARYLDRLTWVDDYDTFAERDALAAFPTASYELAAAAAANAGLLSGTASNVSSVSDGGTLVSYFYAGAVRVGTTVKLPSIVHELVGQYLATADLLAVFGGTGVEGDEDNPFADEADYDRTESY